MEGEKAMRLSYDLTEPDAATIELAEKILQLLISSGLTYQQADNALTEAQKMLIVKTKPVI
jgi:hypothetical protein